MRLFYPILITGDIVYNCSGAGVLLKLDQLQYQIALLISGAMKGSNKVKVLNSLNWTNLCVRRKLHCTVFTFKVLNNVNNSSNKKLFDSYKRTNVRPGLRNHLPFAIPSTSSQHFRRTTILFCIDLWNTLPSEIIHCQTISLLKNNFRHMHIQHNLPFPLNKSKNIPRKHEIPLNRLRAGLLLNSEKFAHNFINVSPQCDCGQPQTGVHVFFHCPVNTQLRLQLFESLSEDDDVNNVFNSFKKQRDKYNFLIYGVHDDMSLNVNSTVHMLEIVAQFLYDSLRLYN